MKNIHTEFHVYELVDKNEKVIYVGQTTNPDVRYVKHTRNKRGKFYHDDEVRMVVVATFDCRKFALAFEEKLQSFHGLETDREKYSKAMENARRFRW